MGWAFGLGLERLAMVLFSIPDIRLFWSTDPRFLDQFQDGRISSFQSFSKFPPCFKDVSFWLPENHGSDPYHENYVFEVCRLLFCLPLMSTSKIIRCEAGDIVERVEKFDEFTHPKTGKKSQAFRITYRDVSRSPPYVCSSLTPNRNLTNAEVDEIQWRVRESLVHKLGVILR